MSHVTHSGIFLRIGQQVKRELLEVNNEAIVISSFLTPKALCAIFAHTALTPGAVDRCKKIGTL
jgi:hypothetical protein